MKVLRISPSQSGMMCMAPSVVTEREGRDDGDGDEHGRPGHHAEIGLHQAERLAVGRGIRHIARSFGYGSCVSVAMLIVYSESSSRSYNVISTLRRAMAHAGSHDWTHPRKR